MNGFLNTAADFYSDLSLVLILVLFGVAAYGGIQARRKNFDRHHSVMITAALLNWIPILIVMVPSWLNKLPENQEIFSQTTAITPLAHGVIGAAAQLLITYTMIRMSWLKNLPPKRSLWLMRITLGFWALSVIGGTFTYLSLYVV